MKKMERYLEGMELLNSSKEQNGKGDRNEISSSNKTSRSDELPELSTSDYLHIQEAKEATGLSNSLPIEQVFSTDDLPELQNTTSLDIGSQNENIKNDLQSQHAIKEHAAKMKLFAIKQQIAETKLWMLKQQCLKDGLGLPPIFDSQLEFGLQSELS